MPKASPKLILLLGMVGISFSSILVRFSAAPSLVTATYRIVWSVLLLTPLLIRHRKELKNLVPKDFLLCGASGFLLALHFAAWFESLKRTTVASSTVLVSTDVIFCALGFVVFLKGKIPKLGVGAIAVTFAGSVLVALGAGSSGQRQLSGDLLALLGAVLVSGYVLIGRVQRGHLSTTVYTYLTYFSCALSLLLLDLITGTPLVGWGPKEVGIGLLLGLVCTLLGHSVYSWSLKYLSPAYVSSVKLIEPVFASVLAVVFFGEIPGPLQIVGAIVILGGILLFTYAENREEDAVT